MLMCGFNLHPASFETVDPMPQHPNWSLLASTHIAPDKEEAAKCIRTCIDDVQVFSDSSGLDACIGAAAVVTHPHGRPHLQFSLGKITAHTVFESELVGILPPCYTLAPQILVCKNGTHSSRQSSRHRSAEQQAKPVGTTHRECHP